jgi:DNA-binding XRE family transcriptional regulator
MARRRLPPNQRLPARLRLGRSIREARRSTGLTQGRLAQCLGLKGRAIYRWERNETAPSGRHREALIREIHRLNPEAGLKLQAALTNLTGKSYAVVPGSAQGSQDAPPRSVEPAFSPSVPCTPQPSPPCMTSVVSPSAVDMLELAILRMADELDLAPRRVRRALARLTERLRSVNLSIDSIRPELERLLAEE